VLWRAWCANSANDVFVVPPWKACAHTAEKESVLFSISDRPSQEALGIWREGRQPASGRGLISA
jgi:gentisate 1,2-dioxygenase